MERCSGRASRIYLTATAFTQVYMGVGSGVERCTKIIREQVNYIIDCKAYFNSRLIVNKCYTKENYLINGEQGSAGTRKRPKEWKETFCATDELRSLYDTEEIVKGLKIGRTSEQEKIASRILKAMQD